VVGVLAQKMPGEGSQEIERVSGQPARIGKVLISNARTASVCKEPEGRQ
jgi:hypothetical protein